MGRTSTVKFLDELQFKAKDYTGSGLYKRIQITGEDTFSEKNGGIFAKGVASATTTDKLIDSSASFTAALVGKMVDNKTDGTSATITNCDSATSLSLSANIMASGESYEIVMSLIGRYAVIVPVTPVTKAVDITMGGQEYEFAAGTPIGLGKRAGDTITSLGVSDVDCSDFAEGDLLVFDVMVDYEELVVSTNYTEELALEYIDSKSGSAPEFTRAIKEKGVIRHRKQNLDPERTLSISQKYQSRTAGLMKLSGRDYILKVTRMDDNFLIPTEVDYFYQCYHNAPEPSGSSGAQDSTVSFEIMYEKRVSIGG